MNTNKKKYIDIYLSPYELYNFDVFTSKFASLNKLVRYCLLFRVCYGSKTSYKMLGNQLNFQIVDSPDKNEVFKRLHENIISRLDNSMLSYKYNENDLISIQFLVYTVLYTDKVVKNISNKFNSNKLGVNKDLVVDTNKRLDLGYNKLLPLTMDLQLYNNKIDTTCSEGSIKSVLINEKWEAFPDLIKSKNPHEKDMNLKENTHISIDNKGKYVTVVEKPVLQKNNSDADALQPQQHNINIYTVDGGHVVKVTDTKISDTSFSRVVGNVTNVINKNSVITKTTLNVKLEPIKTKRTNLYLANLQISNPNIGTLDLETYVVDKISKVYALGFYTKQHKLKTFYINPETLDSNELILNCIDSMLTAKYSGYTFYVHNLGRYDVVFLLKTLIQANLKEDIYKLEIISRDDLILSFMISKKINTKNYKIKIVDSYNILSHSLKDLCKAYKSETVKDIFPYEFMTKDTLFYIGDKPAISMYNDLNKVIHNETPRYNVSSLTNIIRYIEVTLNNIEISINILHYDTIPNHNWSSELETIKYLGKDLISLYEIIDKFSDYVYLKYNVQVSNSLTISSLALGIFLSKYYNKNIPLIVKRSLYEDIKQSYFGGITEVYKPTNINNETLYYYDVNSLYPYASLNTMPGLNCLFEADINLSINDIPNFFGFYYCKVVTTNSYLGLLPVRTRDGLIMPNGSWEGWYFSEELKFVAAKGYDIFVYKGYTFNKTNDIFYDYVNDFYKIKSTSSDVVEKSVAKSLLNNLLGRFGLNIDKPSTRLVSDHVYNELLQTKTINNVLPIDDKFLVTYSNIVSKEICEESNVDYKNSVLNNLKDNKESEHTFFDVSIAIASAVTSYARISINKAKLDIIDRGGNIYYSDTDSIVTNTRLDSSLVGTKLGQFKLEHIIKEAYFISSKTYLIIDMFSNIIIKAKGVSKNSKLNKNDFINLYKGQKLTTGRTESYKNFSEGYVNLNIKNIILNGDAYTKRSKIYDGDKWIDTKPLSVNKEYEKSII